MINYKKQVFQCVIFPYKTLYVFWLKRWIFAVSKIWKVNMHLSGFTCQPCAALTLANQQRLFPLFFIQNSKRRAETWTWRCYNNCIDWEWLHTAQIMLSRSPLLSAYWAKMPSKASKKAGGMIIRNRKSVKDGVVTVSPKTAKPLLTHRRPCFDTCIFGT